MNGPTLEGFTLVFCTRVGRLYVACGYVEMEFYERKGSCKHSTNMPIFVHLCYIFRSQGKYLG